MQAANNPMPVRFANIDQLLAAAAHPKDREALAVKLGIDAKQVLELANRLLEHGQGESSEARLYRRLALFELLLMFIEKIDPAKIKAIVISDLGDKPSKKAKPDAMGR